MSTYFFLVRKFNHGPNDPSPVGTTNPRLNIPSEMLQRLLCDSHAKATRSAISRRHFSLQYDTSYNDFGTEPCPSIGGLPSTNSYLFINNNTVTPSISYYCHPSYYCHSYSGTRLWVPATIVRHQLQIASTSYWMMLHLSISRPASHHWFPVSGNIVVRFYIVCTGCRPGISSACYIEHNTLL